MRAMNSCCLTVLLLLGGCSTVPTLPNAKPAVADAIWDGEPPALCLALSGGGIRSGAVSLGVLQGLHEQGLLQEADLVSTVSGGGYPVYGLIAKGVRAPSATLDSLLADGSKFITTSENSPFITTGDGVFSAFLGGGRVPLNLLSKIIGPTPDLVEQGSLSYLYAMDIHDTFVGYMAPTGGGISLAQTKSVGQGLGFPYWIIQTSASPGLGPPLNTHRYEFGDVFELSPDWIGSEKFGYMRSYLPSLTLMYSVVASAAAVDAPRTNNDDFAVPAWAKRIGFGLGVGMSLQDGKQVFLSDGGFIENQAVIPLLRRNCKTILALDASHDPDAKMRGWSNVATYMHANGWQVAVPHFVKGTSPAGKPKDAWDLPSHLYVLSGSKPDQTRVDILVMKLGIDRSEVALYPAAVQDFWREQLGKGVKEPGCNGLKGLKNRCTFPQQATVTQLFKPAEFRAYRCLGYHLVKDVVARPSSGHLYRPDAVFSSIDCAARPPAPDVLNPADTLQ